MHKNFVNKTIVLSFQPYSIVENGGSSRILRRLIEGRESHVHFVSITDFNGCENGNYSETRIGYFLRRRWWMRWKFREFYYFLRDVVFFKVNALRILRCLDQFECKVFHIVNHSKYCGVALESWKKRPGCKLWVSFHDHFECVESTRNDAKALWLLADRRYVISHKMAEVYSKEFGTMPYQVITDGLKAIEISNVKKFQKGVLTLYFGGLLHISYYKNFKVLFDTLDYLSVSENRKFRVVLRGTQRLPFDSNRKFDVVYLPFTLDSDELNADLVNADILYLPLKFDNVKFSSFSLSTKLISFLGAPGVILYHGPSFGAAFELLDSNFACLKCTALDTVPLAEQLLRCEEFELISMNAKKLASSKFQLEVMQSTFWDC